MSRFLAVAFFTALIGMPPARHADATDPARPDSSIPPPAPPDDRVMALLQATLPPGPEPRIRWDWEPGALDPLARPLPEDFGWRIRQLTDPALPPVARARLCLELALLTTAARGLADPHHPDHRADVPFEGLSAIDSGKLISEARLQYLELLKEHPDHGEFLTDLGDVHRLAGRADSALAMYRRALASPRPPSRLFSRLAENELEAGSRFDSLTASRIREFREKGTAYFRRDPPADSTRAARFLLDQVLFRMNQALAEVRADRLANPGAWSKAGADSVLALLARVVSPATRKLAARAAEMDTNLDEAYGVLGSLVTGQILLPIAARGILARERAPDADSLAASLLKLIEERKAQRSEDLKYAAALLNRCESLEPGRYTRVRVEQARLALVFGDWDGSAGLWRAMAARHPNREDLVEELFSVYRLEASAGASREPGAGGRSAAARLGAFLAGTAPEALNGNIIALLGWTRALSGDRESALAAHARAVELDSSSWRGQLGLAIHHLNMLDATAAEPHLRAAGDLFQGMDDPGRSAYCGLVGLLYRARRDVPSARRWLLEAVGFDPRNGTAIGALEDLQRALNPR